VGVDNEIDSVAYIGQAIQRFLPPNASSFGSKRVQGQPGGDIWVEIWGERVTVVNRLPATPELPDQSETRSSPGRKECGHGG